MFFAAGVYWWSVVVCAYSNGCELSATSPPTRHQDPPDQPGRLAHRVLRVVREELQLHPDRDQGQGRRGVRAQGPGMSSGFIFLPKPFSER